jgi:hypothetical protein
MNRQITGAMAVAVALLMGVAGPAQAATEVTQTQVVDACTAGGNAAACKAIVAAFVAYLKSSGLGTAAVNKMVAATVMALVKDSGGLPQELRDQIQEAVTGVAVASSDARQIAAITAVAQSVGSGTFVETAEVDNGLQASAT